ncbi:hypothetical protein [Capybara microvirus Cap1_SP_137]|nr:hypothetical protein [Capybara microvirus Cap1_SP_137]
MEIVQFLTENPSMIVALFSGLLGLVNFLILIFKKSKGVNVDMSSMNKSLEAIMSGVSVLLTLNTTLHNGKDDDKDEKI